MQIRKINRSRYSNVKLSTNNIKKVRVQLSWITFDFNFVFSWLLFDRALKNGSLLLYVLYQLSRDDSIAMFIFSRVFLQKHFPGAKVNDA